jgi:hypothetical protein
MAKKIESRTKTTTKRKPKTATKPAAKSTVEPYSKAGLANRIDAEVVVARLAVARLLEVMGPSTTLEGNAGQALDVPSELARIAVALRGIRSASAFVRCLEVAS